MRLMLLNAPLELLRELLRHDLEIIAVDHPHHLSRYHNLGPRCTLVPHITCAKLDVRAVWTLRQAIVQHQPDVLQAFWPKSLANAVLATTGLRRPPRIVSFRGIASPPSKWDPANYMTFLSPRIALHACESHAVQEGLLRGGIAAEKCDVVYNCVRPETFSRPGRSALAEFNIPASAFVVGTVAAIRSVKGIDLLLEAAIECQDLTDLHFLLVGSLHDSRVERLLRDPRLAGRVTWTGFRDDAVALASGFDVFAMPSRQEALCRALLEAMGQQVCPLVSDAGGMKELVRHEVDGLVFPAENVAALGAAIRRLHADRAAVARYAASARDRVAQMCSPAKMCDRLLGMYRRLAA
jgi:glycosyltransferase involved in cell wall biosynthesis